MEYVLVTYPEDRIVYVDGEDNGLTNTIIRVGSGSHGFDLGDPKDYSPPSIVEQVTGTSPLEPLTLVFVRQGAAR